MLVFVPGLVSRMHRVGKLLLIAAIATTVSASVQGPDGGAQAAIGAQAQGLGAHRVIVRYAGKAAGAGSGAKGEDNIRQHAQRLEQQPGVLKVQGLPRLGMAVVGLSSEEAGEQLVEDLQGDDLVDLVVPDTWMKAFDLGAEASQSSGLHRMLRQVGPIPAQCSAHPACQLRGLTGECCPVPSGEMLSCCSASGPDLVAIKTFFGTYLSEQENGAIGQASGPVQASSIFEIWANHDNTILFKSQSGKFLTVDDHGMLHMQDDDVASSDKIKFKVSHNANGTVSLAAHTGYYLASEPHGVIVANRPQADLWEQFTFLEQASQDQRFSDDNDANELWGMHHYAGFDIDAPEAWKIWTGDQGKGITVAVIDTGIDYNHEDLKEQMWVNPLEIPGNGVDDDQNGYVDDIHGADFANEDGDPMDDQMHGTHCAGTIAGVGNNGIGVAGVAWRGVRLMALKFLDATGSGRTSDAVRAIDYAVAHGAKIASNSWGGGGSNSALRVAIEHAEAVDMLFTAAAGNEGSNNDEVPSFPANYDISNVISVASSTWEGELSSFSCFGNTTVDVAAPGSNIYSTVPGGGYATLSGTSMATPHVTGLAALVWMYRPQLSMRQVKEVILGSVRKLAAFEDRLATAGLINAKNALESAWAFEAPRPPVHAPQAIAFEDVDSRIGTFSGTVTITAAADESDVEYYQVYFVSAAGFQLEALGNRISVTGQQELTLKVDIPFAPPKYAQALMVVSGRASGEMPATPDSSAPHVDLEDYGLPLTGPKSATWDGDTDLRNAYIKGSLTIERASSEASVTSYNVYWAETSLSPDNLVGKVAATGFREPQCSGKSCDLIQRSRTPDGVYHYEHLNYGNSEAATIDVSGPGVVTITKFETEHYYDSLTIGETRLSGNITSTLPYSVELPAAVVSIRWMADESISGIGWQFDIYQEGATALLEVATQVQSSAFVVYPAFGRNELHSASVYAAIPDYAMGMPPSPAFAPRAIDFVDADETSGSVSGVARVTPASAIVAGAVEFYKLCIVDAAAQTSDVCWTQAVDDSNFSKPVSFDIPATHVSSNSSMELQAHAGNQYGLGDGFASVRLVDVTTSGASDGGRRLRDEGAVGKAPEAEASSDPAVGEDAGLADIVEPQQYAVESKEQLLWSAHPTTLLAGAGAPHGCVRSQLFVRGLDSEAGSGPAFRAALQRTLASHLPGAEAGGVRLLRVATVPNAESAAPGDDQGDELKAEIEVETPADAPLTALDRLEARLILLSSGGRASSRFEAAFAAELQASGLTQTESSSSLHVRFGAPQQLSPKMLAAASASHEMAESASDRQLRAGV